MRFAQCKILLLTVLVWLAAGTVIQAQDTLALEQAIAIGLENNYSIRIARNESDISTNNRSLGNAGFLPTLSATGSRINRNENNEQRFTEESGIPDRTINDAETINTNASASLNWTVFDGLRMFTTHEKLRELESLGEQQFRVTLESKLAQIISVYYNIIRRQKTYDVLKNTVEISEQRIQIAETKRDLGSGSEYDLLQGRADLNADKAAVMRQEILLNDAKVLLNELLARDIDINFEIQEKIEIDRELVYNDLIQQALSNNLDLAVFRTDHKVAELDIREIQAERFPEIDLSAGFNFSKTESGAGFLELNRTDGFSYGVTARWNIFDGFNLNRRLQNARIRLKNQELLVEDKQQQVKADLSRQFKSYANSLNLVELETENLSYARQSLEIALERFRLGSIDSIELREVQRTFINAENRLIQAQFEAKVAETELLRLSGQLIQSAE